MKKTLILLSPLTVLPVFSIISCNNQANNESTIEKPHLPLPIQGLDQPDPNLPDEEKAWIMTQLFFKAKAGLYAAHLPSKIQVYNVTNKKQKAPFEPTFDLGFLDPRQNFGFKMEWVKNSIKNDDQNGTKSGTIVLTRGSQRYKHEITIDGFLTTSDAEVEKQNPHLNPAKVVQLFDRGLLSTKSIEIGSQFYIDDFYHDYKDDLDRLATDFERMIIDPQYLDQTKIEFKDLYQNSRFGLQAPEMSASFRLVDRKNPNLKSGWYRITWIGFDPIRNNLRTPELFDKYVIDWQTISNMLNIDDSKVGYLTKVKPSEVKDINHFKQLIDLDMLNKQNLIATPLEIIDANDQLGYLEISFDLKYKNGPNDFPGKQNVPIKIYGFKPQAN